MLRWLTLCQSAYLSRWELSIWKDVIYKIAQRNFKSVPIEDIEAFLAEATTGNGTVYVIYSQNHACGFGAALYGTFTYRQRSLPYLVLDVGCLDAHLRGRQTLTFIGLIEILRHKFSSWQTLLQKTYVLGICLTPFSYSMYRMPEYWSGLDFTPINKQPLYESLVASFCKRFHLHYQGMDQPIHFNTWLPTHVPTLNGLQNARVDYFLRLNPNWQLGYGLPIVFPMGWRNLSRMVGLLLAIYTRKISHSISSKIMMTILSFSRHFRVNS